MKKRFIALFLVLMMLLQLAPAAVLSEETPAPTAVPYSGGIGSNVVSGRDYATVTFIAFDGTELSTLNVQLGQPIGEIPEVPAREGFVVIGWRTEAGEEVTKDTVVKADMKVIASYYNYAFPVLKGKHDNDKMIVEFIAPEGALPDGTRARMEFVPLTAEQKSAIAEKMGADTEEISAVDIYFIYGAEKFKPIIPVKVTITLKNKPVEPVSVVHLTDDGQAEVVASGITEQAFDFETKSFSVYAVVGGVNVAADDTTKLITIKYVAGEHGSVSLDQEDVYLSASIPSTYGSTAIPEDGYMFTNWTDESGEEVSQDAFFQPVIEKKDTGSEAPNTVTFTANFTECYVLTFRDRDGKPQTIIRIPKGEAIGDQLPSVISRDDYIAYWAIGTSSEGPQGIIWTPGARIDATYVPESNVDIIPDYDMITYTVTFYTDEEKSERVGEPQSVNYLTSYCVNDIPPVPEKEGCTGKWVYSGGDFNNSVAVSGNTDVWAVYDRNVFTVTYKYEDAEGTEKVFETDTYYSGDTLTLPTDPVVEGKEFDGWYIGETKYVGGEQVTSDLELTAKFRQMYNVSFVVLNEDGSVSERLSQYFRTAGEAIGQMPQNPFVQGKIFDKWVIQNTETEVKADTIVNNDMTVVAVFHPITVYTITAEYYYQSKMTPGKEVIFNTDILQVEADELPYTITAPSSTHTDEEEIGQAGVIYYPETPTITVTENNFDENRETTVRFQYVPFTAKYDYVYMLKDLEGEGYTEIPNSRVSEVEGVLNSFVTPTVKEFDYAVLEKAEGATITKSGLDGQDKQELYVYYTRKNFQLTYETNGGSYVSGTTAAYGSSVQVSSTPPTRDGYTFAGWFLDEALTQPAGSSVLVKGNTTLYAKWTANTVDYTIVYMFEKYNDAGTETSYVVDTSETGRGIVGSEVFANDSSIPDKTKKGWEKDTEKNAETSVVITADGSAVLLVYYKLKTYTFTFDINGSSTENRYRMTIKRTTYQDGNNSQTKYSFTAKLGQDVSADWPINGGSATIWDNNNRNKQYFYYWTCQGTNYASKILRVTDVLLPNNNSSNISVTGSWRNNNDTVQVNYYLQNADNNNYSLSTLYSQTSPNGSYSPKEISGFTYHHSDNDTDWWGNVTEYNFYYNRHAYQIEYYHGTDKLRTIENVKYDATISGSTYNWMPTQQQCGVDSDYTWGGWYADSKCEGTPYVFSKMPAGATNGSVALVLYAKWVAPTYDVSFVDGEDTSTVYETKTVEKYKTVTAPQPNPTKDGYTFDGWYTTADGDQLFDFNTQITADTTVYAHWTRKMLDYTVHYVDGDGNEVAPPKSVINPNFEVGQVVEEQAVAVAGYRPDSNSKTLTLAGENNVITFVYTPKTETTSYKVRYIIDADEFPGDIPVAAEKTVENVPGEHSTVIEMAAAVDYAALYEAHSELKGYEFFPDKVEKTMVLSSDPDQNVLTFYYSKYRSADVKVHYVDMDGNPIPEIASHEEVLKVGKTFTLSRPPIDGWELNKAVVGTSYSGDAAGSDYKITEAVAAGDGLEFTLFYQKKATITAKSYSKQYDGSELKLPADIGGQVIVDGLLPNDTLSSVGFAYTNTDNTTNDGRINAGVARVTPKNAEISGVHTKPNYYKIRYISGTLEVDKINVTVRVEPDRWVNNTYNGNVWKAGFTNASKDIDDYILISHKGYKDQYLNAIWDAVKSKARNDQDAAGLKYVLIEEKDAGDYTHPLGLTLADLPNDQNYSVSLYVRDGRLEILPKEVTITTPSESKAYDGKPLTKGPATITGLVGADADKVTVTANGSQTDVGKSTNTYTITWGDGVKDSNYRITENLGTLVVTPADLTITIKDKTVPYNGTEQSGYSAPTTTITGTGETIESNEYIIEGLAKDQVLTITGYTPSKGTDVGTHDNGSFETAVITVKNSNAEDAQDVTNDYIIKTNKGKLIIEDVTLTITKIVDDDYSREKDTKEFTFTLKVGNGTTAPGSPYYWKKNGGAEEGYLQNGTTFKLKHNDTIMIRVPVNQAIELTESGNDYYDVEWKVNGETSGTGNSINIERIVQSGNTNVVVTNTRDLFPVTLKKVVTGNLGNPDDEFSFTVKVYADAQCQNEIQHTTESEWVSEATRTSRTTADSLGIGHLPMGTYVKITEADPGEAAPGTPYKTKASSDGTTPTINETTPDTDLSREIKFQVVKPEGKDSIDVVFNNYANIVIPTGIALDSAPYLFLMAIALLGVGLMIQRRRKENG